MRAGLARISGVDFDHCSTGAFCLVGQEIKEHPPSHICYSTVNAAKVIFPHIVDVQVFNGYEAVRLNELVRELVGEVASFIRYSFVNASDYSSLPTPFLRALSLLREATLCGSKVLGLLFEKTGVVNLGPIRESHEGRKARIKTDGRFVSRERLLLNFTRKGNEPFSCRVSLDGACFNSPLNGTVYDGPHLANFRETDRFIVQPEAALGIGEGIVSSKSTESRIARVNSLFDSTEESFEGKINSYGHVLKNLRVNIVKLGNAVLQKWKGSLLFVQRKTFLFLFPTLFSLLQKMIVESSALLKSVQKEGLLLVSWKNTIFESLSHGFKLLPCFDTKVKERFQRFSRIVFTCHLKTAAFCGIGL